MPQRWVRDRKAYLRTSSKDVESISTLALVGILLTTLYASSVVMRPAKRYLRLGLDSVVAILAFVIGIAGLIVIAH